MDWETLKPIITGIIRHALTGLGVYLTGAGLNQEQSNAIIAGVAILLVSGISLVYSKFHQVKKVETALELPAGATKEQLEKEMKLK